MPVKTLSPEDTRLLERTLGNWGMTDSHESLVQGAELSVVTGQTAEPDAARLTWRSPHEAVADLSGQTEPMLLRLHFHPGWSAGTQAVLTPGPAGWVQVTSLHNPAQRLVIRWEGTAWKRWGERLSLAGLLASVAGLLFLAFRQRKVQKKRGVKRAERESPSHCPLLTPDSKGDGVASDWITYIHLHSPQGERITQFDGPALAGLLPTSEWQADALYIDRRQLNLPTGLEPGEYLLRVGLYNFVSGERLPFQADDEKQERFEDGQLLIRLTVAPSSGAHD